MSAQRILNHIAAAFNAGATTVTITMAELDATFGGFTEDTGRALRDLVEDDPYWDSFTLLPTVLINQDNDSTIYWITAGRTSEIAWEAAWPQMQAALLSVPADEREVLLECFEGFREVISETEPDTQLKPFVPDPVRH